MYHEISSFKRELLLNFEPLYIIKGILKQSSIFKEEEFSSLSSAILEHHTNIKSISWLPNIQERNKNVKRSFPILFSSSLHSRAPKVGFDLYSNNRFKEFFEIIKNKNEELFLSSFDLSQELFNKKSLLVFVPIYKDTKNKFFKGFILCEFDIEGIFTKALLLTKIKGINIVLEDISDNKVQIIYKKSKVLTEDKSFRVEKVLKDIGGRIWKFKVTPSYKYIKENRTILPYFISLISIVFVLLGAFYTLIILKRNVIVAQLVEKKTKELSKLNKKLELISRTDVLTNIANRRYFNDYVKNEWNRALRDKLPLSIIMIDIDYFKQYNDTYGHLQGDECLIKISSNLNKVLNRSSDLLARYGGEEFVMVLPNTKNAFDFAKNFTKIIESLKIPHKNSKVSKYVTISVGIASIIPNKSLNLLGFLKKSDDALYKAKQNGRNQVFYSQIQLV